jgi:hypothetical protein
MVNLTYIVSTYINITIYPPVQLLCANKIIKNKRITGLGLGVWLKK